LAYVANSYISETPSPSPLHSPRLYYLLQSQIDFLFLFFPPLFCQSLIPEALLPPLLPVLLAPHPCFKKVNPFFQFDVPPLIQPWTTPPSFKTSCESFLVGRLSSLACGFSSPALAPKTLCYLNKDSLCGAQAADASVLWLVDWLTSASSFSPLNSVFCAPFSRIGRRLESVPEKHISSSCIPFFPFSHNPLLSLSSPLPLNRPSFFLD